MAVVNLEQLQKDIANLKTAVEVLADIATVLAGNIVERVENMDEVAALRENVKELKGVIEDF